MPLYITKRNIVAFIGDEQVKEFGVISKGQFEFVSSDHPNSLITIRMGEVFEGAEPIASPLIRFLLSTVIESAVRINLNGNRN